MAGPRQGEQGAAAGGADEQDKSGEAWRHRNSFRDDQSSQPQVQK
jgi:hypothetical protein